MRNIVTSATQSLVSVLAHCIFLIKWMSVNTMSFSCVNCSRAHAAEYVFFFSNKFQMSRINTLSISAKVINLMGWRYFMVKIFERMAMSAYRFINESKITVAVFIKTASPVPTFFGKFYKFKKRFSSISLSHVYILTVLFMLSSK